MSPRRPDPLCAAIGSRADSVRRRTLRRGPRFAGAVDLATRRFCFRATVDFSAAILADFARFAASLPISPPLPVWTCRWRPLLIWLPSTSSCSLGFGDLPTTQSASCSLTASAPLRSGLLHLPGFAGLAASSVGRFCLALSAPLPAIDVSAVISAKARVQQHTVSREQLRPDLALAAHDIFEGCELLDAHGPRAWKRPVVRSQHPSRTRRHQRTGSRRCAARSRCRRGRRTVGSRAVLGDDGVGMLRAVARY